MEIIIRGTDKELRDFLDQPHILMDSFDDLAGDVNHLRGRVSQLEITRVDPNKMFDETYLKVKEILRRADGHDTPKQKGKGKQTGKGSSETI